MKPVSEVIEYYENATKEEAIYDLYMDYVDLQQENKQLKEQLEQNSKINVSDHKYASKKEDEFITYKHIIDELEKWLKGKLKEMQLIIDDVDISFEVDYERIDEARSCKIAYNTALNKIQELKGSDKE